MKVSDSTAIITGGASGLGEATARMLADGGAQIIIFDLDKQRGQLVAREIGGEYIQVDVTTEGSVQQALDQVVAKFGEVRILVNCAGVALGQKTTDKGAPHVLQDFERVININLIGTFNCVRLLATHMAGLDTANGEERGVIINAASVAAFDGQIGQAAYAASKGAVAAMTLPIARDLARHAIRVMTIAPGIFKTPMLAGLPQKVQESLAENIPFPSRLADPAEYASLVKHICENAMLNGETIRLDGAIRLAPK